MSKRHTIDLIYAYYKGEAEAQRQIRRYISSLGRRSRAGNNRKVQLDELMSDAAARSAQLSKELRAQNLLRAYLAGKDYLEVEQKIRHTTLKVEHLIAEVDLVDFFDFDFKGFLEWASEPIVSEPRPRKKKEAVEA